MAQIFLSYDRDDAAKALNPCDRFLRELRVARMLQVESYVLFRPWLDKQRRDPRFIALAARLGLVDYWRSSGQWPDYCSEPDLPYDCKAEAAKHG